jgi:hypothetical protein
MEQFLWDIRAEKTNRGAVLGETGRKFSVTQ